MQIEGMDSVDNRILEVIRDNARLTYSEIGEQVGISIYDYFGRKVVDECRWYWGEKQVIDLLSKEVEDNYYGGRYEYKML